jgi:GrpB-like predicted nucleotidyltransferase (UPF0157 family)
MLRKIRIVPYDERWPDLFAAESVALAPVFGGRTIALHHVGSTSIPGLPAKPIIDILVVVDDICRVDSLNAAMVALGYEPQGEYGIPGRRFFTKGGDLKRTHHIHVFQQGHPEVGAMLDFRDYLRSHPSQAAEYGRLKGRVALACQDDITAYNAGKDIFVKDLIRQARTWRDEMERDRQGQR